MADRFGIPRNTNEEYTFTATALLDAGELVDKFGVVWAVMGESQIQIGETATVRSNLAIDLLKTNPADVIAEEGTVLYDPATKKQKVDGTLTAGKAVKESAAGDPYVLTFLNL